MSEAMKRRAGRGTMTAWLVISALMLTAAGCARPDWIEQTLVTVDVTGVWRGNLTKNNASLPTVLTLQQSGPKVTGQITLDAVQSAGRIDSPIEATVAGDRLSFRDSRGRVTGEVQVNGDEMTGSGSYLGHGTFYLRRQP